MNENGYSVTLLDFPDKDIFIITESGIEKVYRAKACEKEPFTVEWLKDFAHKGVFYDIGANVGSYSLIAASLMSDDKIVVAFEPVFFNFYRLNENIFINQLNSKIIPLNIALANSNRVAPLYLPRLDFGISPQASEQTGLFVNVLYITLDSIVESGALPFPAHIKIDVDGNELEVLGGGKKTFSDERLRSVMIEVDESNTEIMSKLYEFLSGAGFNLYAKKELLLSKNVFGTLFLKE